MCNPQVKQIERERTSIHRTEAVRMQQRQQTLLQPQMQQDFVQQQNSMQQESDLQRRQEEVNRNMPGVTTEAIQQAVQVERSASRAEAEKRLEDAAKFWGDSRLMGQIKHAMKDLNRLMSLELRVKPAEFEQTLAERHSRYALLIRLCETYDRKRRGTRREPGMTRLRLIGEIREFLVGEQEKLEACAQAVHADAVAHMEERREMPTWIDVLRDARSTSLAQAPQGYEFTRREELTQKQMDRRVAVVRVAKLLNISHVVADVKHVKLGEGDAQQDGYLEEKQETTLDQIPMEQDGIARLFQEDQLGQTFCGTLDVLKQKMDAINRNYSKKEDQVHAVYTAKALRDLGLIRDMDALLRISRSDSELVFTFQTQTGKARGTKCFQITSVKALHCDQAVSEQAEEQGKTGKKERIVDRQLASRILSLPEEVLEGALLDAVDQKQIQAWKQSLKRWQKDLGDKNGQFMDSSRYRENAIAMKINLQQTFEVSMIKDSVAELQGAKNVRVMPKPGHRVDALDPGKLDALRVHLKTYDQKSVGQVREWEQMLEKTRAYLDVWSNAPQSKEVIEATKGMLDALHAWDEKQGKKQEEQQAIDAFKSHMCSLFGPEIFQVSEKGQDAQKRDRFDEDMLLVARLKWQLKHPDSTDRKLDIRDRSTEPLFTHRPCLSDLKQGMVGDCYLLSALAAIVKNDPDSLYRLMTDHGDTVTVHFRNRDVTVSKKVISCYKKDESGNFQMHGDYYARDTLWVQIMEKALAMSGLVHSEVNLDSGQEEERLREALRKEVLQSKRSWKDYPQGLAFGMESIGLEDLVYRNSVEKIAGGQSSNVLTKLLGLEFEEKKNRIYTVEDLSKEKIMEHLWGNVGGNRQMDSQSGLRAKPEWKNIKSFLKKHLQDPLQRELEFRQYNVYQTSSGGKTQKVKKAYRSVTIEDIQETLLDLPHWRVAKGEWGYERLRLELRDRFPDLQITTEIFDQCLRELGEEMSQVNASLEKNLEHRRQMEQTDTGKYSDRAKEIYRSIRDALNDKKYVVAGTHRFKPKNSAAGEGLNGESMREGMAQGHAYTVLDCRKENDRYFITLHNPWGTGSMGYGQVTEVDGTTHTVGFRQNTDNFGIFEIELNDFMQFIGRFDISK